MPQITLVASSCAITLPPAATICRRATGAVAAHAGHHQRQVPGTPDFGRRGEQRIDRRLAEIDRRPVVEHDHRGAAAARHPHVPSARREINRAGQDRFAVHRLMHRPAARPRKMLGKNDGERWRHVLRDQHRRAFGHRLQLGHNLDQRLRPAGRSADQQHARCHG